MAQHLAMGGREYGPKDYSRLLGSTGFSDDLLRTHFSLYEGYVQNTNKAMRMLREGRLDPYVEGEVRRRFVWEFNGMRLHEVFFGGLRGGGSDLPEDAPLRDAVQAEFGGWDAWLERFRQIGTTRGIGWVALQYDGVQDRLLNTWINEHDAGVLAGSEPVLLLDVFEHAYMRDFGTDRRAYMDAYFDAVDWRAADQRFRRVRECAQHAQGEGPAR